MQPTLTQTEGQPVPSVETLSPRERVKRSIRAQAKLRPGLSQDSIATTLNSALAMPMMGHKGGLHKDVRDFIDEMERDGLIRVERDLSPRSRGGVQQCTWIRIWAIEPTGDAA